MFTEGQRVEVINASDGFAQFNAVFPLKLGEVTTVRRVYGLGVKIEGDTHDRYWHRDRFRSATDISVLKNLLVTTRECIDA